MSRRPRLSLGIIVADCFSMSGFAIFIDLMRLAAGEGDSSRPADIRWEVMSNRSSPTRASCGVEMGRTSELVSQSLFDYIVVIGGLSHDGSGIDDAAAAYLREAARIGVPLIGIGTGSFILSKLGLISDRSFCVAEGASTADLALYLIARHIGKSAAQQAQAVLQFDRMRYDSELPELFSETRH